MHMGVGGDISWDRSCMDKYLIKPAEHTSEGESSNNEAGRYAYSLRFVPFALPKGGSSHSFFDRPAHIIIHAFLFLHFASSRKSILIVNLFDNRSGNGRLLC
jgi:hypothetical protein